MLWMKEVTSSTGRTLSERNETSLDRTIWRKIRHEIIKRRSASEEFITP